MGVGCSDAEVQSPCQPARMYEGVGGGDRQAAAVYSG